MKHLEPHTRALLPLAVAVGAGLAAVVLITTASADTDPSRISVAPALAQTLDQLRADQSWPDQTMADQQVADLKTWLHGEPKLPPKAAPPAQLAQVSRAKGVAADAAVEDFLRAMATAIKAREGQVMLPRLSERYSVDDVPSGAKPGDFFVQAIDRMPGPLEIVLLGISTERDARLARIELRFSNDRVSQKTLRFDTAGKLLGSDLFVLKRQHAFG